MRKRTLTRKGHSRLYVEHAADTDKVLLLIKEKDEFEFGYLPEGWVAEADTYPHTVYTGKFDDMDMDELVAELWALGVKCWVYDAGWDR